jgi:hypothetical protein
VYVKLIDASTSQNVESADGESSVMERDVSIDSSDRRCVNCGCSETGRWRLVNRKTMCNACGLYFSLNGVCNRNSDWKDLCSF